MKKWLWKLLELLLIQASPQIREQLCVLLSDLEQKAKETDNPWDDILVGILKTVLACPDN